MNHGVFGDLADIILNANRGKSSAQAKLGTMYANGTGVPKDAGLAIQWLRLAAEQGHVVASRNLGLMYANGREVPVNPEEAVKWLRRAAESGDIKAQGNLGVMCARGLGLPRNLQEATHWLQQAAARGDSLAQRNLARIATPAPQAETRDNAPPRPPLQARRFWKRWLKGIALLIVTGMTGWYLFNSDWSASPTGGNLRSAVPAGERALRSGSLTPPPGASGAPGFPGSWGHESLVVGLAAIAMTGLLWQRRPNERPWLRNTFGLCFGSVIGLLLVEAALVVELHTLAYGLREAMLLTGGVAMIRLTGRFLFGYLLPLARFTPPRILEDILVILGYVAWGLVGLRRVGLDLGHLVATSAVLTAVMGLSMQDTLGNLLGGIVLELDNSFHMGDWIKVDDLVGRVVNVEWRTVTIETRNWERVVIPNATLIKSKFLVLGKRQGAPDYWRRWIWFNVALHHPPSRVITMVEKALRRTRIANMASNPPPNCVLMSFESGYGRYAVRYWLSDLAVDDPTDSAVRVTVFAALQREGIKLALNEQSVWMWKDGDKRERQELSRQVTERLSIVQEVDLFRSLNEEEGRVVAERLTPSPFMVGEVITKQGSTAHWLYILVSGEAEVSWSDGQHTHSLGPLRPVTVFGEMGLMTGDPRAATVTAVTEVMCYRLDKPSFESIVLGRPSLAEELSQIMVARRRQMMAAQERYAGKVGDLPLHSHGEILNRIRHFFGLP